MKATTVFDHRLVQNMSEKDVDEALNILAGTYAEFGIENESIHEEYELLKVKIQITLYHDVYDRFDNTRKIIGSTVERFNNMERDVVALHSIQGSVQKFIDVGRNNFVFQCNKCYCGARFLPGQSFKDKNTLSNKRKPNIFLNYNIVRILTEYNYEG